MSSSLEEYEVAVVGAGVMGCWTAVHLAEKGIRTVLLEQFSTGHRAGSSHGHSRITRRVYAEPHYVEMMGEAFKLWGKLEEKTKSKLYIPTGILVFGEEDGNNDMKEVLSSLQQSGVPYEQMTGEEAMTRYPGLRLPKDYLCVLEKDGGILLADKALSTLQTYFKAIGGVLLDNHKVLHIEPGERVTLSTSQGVIRAKRVVLTSGGWGKNMLSQLGLSVPLQAVRTEVLYWKVNNPELFSAANFPTFWYSESNTSNHKLVYGLPSYEYPGLIKVFL